MEYKLCPICKEKIIFDKQSMGNHFEIEHPNDIPKDMCGAQYYYHLKNKGKFRKCMTCHKPTLWNTSTNKYNAFCENPNCKKKYTELCAKRMMGIYGKVTLLNDDSHQKKMLANRKISGVYVWSDGTRKNYTGSYEYDFLRMCDIFLNLESGDIELPCPHTFFYEYEGEKKFYFPDVFIHSLQLVIEIKDGGDCLQIVSFRQ